MIKTWRAVATVALAAMCLGAMAEEAPVMLTLSVQAPGPTISRHLFGQFAEHLGSGVCGGLWVGPDSKVPTPAACATTWSRR